MICFNLKNLNIDRKLLIQRLRGFLALNGCNKQDRRRPTRRKIVLQRDLRGARLCCGLALLYVGIWRHTSLIQAKAKSSLLRGPINCLGRAPRANQLSRSLLRVFVLAPSSNSLLSANLCYREHIDPVWLEPNVWVARLDCVHIISKRCASFLLAEPKLSHS